jgi:hypothetical protein
VLNALRFPRHTVIETDVLQGVQLAIPYVKRCSMGAETSRIASNGIMGHHDYALIRLIFLILRAVDVEYDVR